MYGWRKRGEVVRSLFLNPKVSNLRDWEKANNWLGGAMDQFHPLLSPSSLISLGIYPEKGLRGQNLSN